MMVVLYIVEYGMNNKLGKAKDRTENVVMREIAHELRSLYPQLHIEAHPGNRDAVLHIKTLDVETHITARLSLADLRSSTSFVKHGATDELQLYISCTQNGQQRPKNTRPVLRIELAKPDSIRQLVGFLRSQIEDLFRDVVARYW